VAKASADETIEARRELVSLSGQVMGTLRYMSPEQTQGTSDAIDGRTDIYSLGVILYELVTGDVPYPTSSVDIATAIENIRETAPPRPSKLCKTVGFEIDAIIAKAMEKEPVRRYQSVSELLQDIEAWLDKRPISARSHSSLYVIRKLAFRHRVTSLTILSLLAMSIGLSIISYAQYRWESNNANWLRSLNSQFQTENAALQQAAKESRSRIHQQALGWFLMEWHANHIDRASELRQQVVDGTGGCAESEAMTFLLDDSYSVDQLIKNTSPDTQSLAHYVAGERALKAGRTEEAIQAFQLCNSMPGGHWKASAETRLKTLAGVMTSPGEERTSRPAD